MNKYVSSLHCNLHVYHNFFYSFHDVTRWYFLVLSNEESGKVDKKDIVLPKYVPYDEKNGITTKQISIDIDSKLKYPRKHFSNRTNYDPPSLLQQTLQFIIRNNIAYS